MEHIAQINRIEKKVKLLLQQLDTLKKENLQLKNKLQKAAEELTAKNNILAEYEVKINALRSLTSGLGKEEKNELAKQIGAYIREIDKCIALLSE